MEEPKMFNHNRGLWGYSGLAPGGHPLTIQSTGMGGPSAAIVVSELADLGVRRLIRVGTCGAVHASLGLGELVIANAALAADGTSRALGAGERVSPDPELVAALQAAGDGELRSGLIASTDLFYGEREERFAAAGALAVEMESATLFALAASRGLRAASLLSVSDLLVGERRRIEIDELRAAEHRLGRVALRALVDGA
jgi:uridine phosphorylase